MKHPTANKQNKITPNKAPNNKAEGLKPEIKNVSIIYRSRIYIYKYMKNRSHAAILDKIGFGHF